MDTQSLPASEMKAIPDVAITPEDKARLEEAQAMPAAAEELRRHHNHRPTHDEIAELAYRYWQEDGSPVFDQAVTLNNWLDAVMELEGRHNHAPDGPGHDTE